MALAKANLGYPVACLYNNSDNTAYAVSSSKKAYIRGLLLHNTTTNNEITVSVHFVANSGGSVASSSDSNKVAKLTLSPSDTYFFELAYPFILESNGDSVKVKNLSTTSGDTVNVVVLGDRES